MVFSWSLFLGLGIFCVGRQGRNLFEKHRLGFKYVRFWCVLGPLYVLKINHDFFVKPLFGPRYFFCRTSRQGPPAFERGRVRFSRFIGFRIEFVGLFYDFHDFYFFWRCHIGNAKILYRKGPTANWIGFSAEESAFSVTVCLQFAESWGKGRLWSSVPALSKKVDGARIISKST